MLSHLLRQRERGQAAVPALLSETDPSHRVSAAQDLPSSHQDRLHEPKPSAVLAARHSAGGSQLSDWRWGQCGQMRHWVSFKVFWLFIVSLRSRIHLCTIRAKGILSACRSFSFGAVYLTLCPLFIWLSLASPSASNGFLPIWGLHTVLQAFWDTITQKLQKSFWGPFWDYSKTDFMFLPRPAHAVKHSSVWGQWRLRLCPETSGAVGPKLPDVSAVLSDGEGCGKNEPRRLLPCCELHGGPPPSSTLFWSVVDLSSSLHLLLYAVPAVSQEQRVKRFLFFINISW